MSKKTLIVISPMQSRSGYGQHSRLIIRSLMAIPEVVEKYDISLISIKWGGTPLNALDLSNEQDAMLFKMILPNNVIQTQPDVSIHITIPSEFQRIGKKSFGISALTESSILPSNMIEGLNKVDMTIVPSEFTKNVAINSTIEKIDKNTNTVVESIKVNTPLEVLFEGLDLGIYDKNNVVTGDLSKTISNVVEESFAYLFVGHWMSAPLGQDRKDVGMLVYTFFNTFKNKKKKPALILKTSGAGFSMVERDQILNYIEQIKDLLREQGFQGKFPSVYVLNGNLTELEMNELYNHPKVGAMVTFTHGEGFGLPLLEFSITGKPIIASNYSGHLDFLNPDYCELLPGSMIKIEKTAQNEWITDSEWFQVNYQYAGQLLVDMFENYDKFLVRSRKHPKYTKDNFSFERMTEKLKQILDRYGLFKDNSSENIIKLPQLRKV